MMKEDVIDLISDGEDSCDESPEKKPLTSQKVQANANGATSNMHSSKMDLRKNTSKDKLDIANRHIPGNESAKVKTEENGNHLSQSTTASFLSNNSVPRKMMATVQAKDLSRRFWKAGDYEVNASSVKSLPNGMDHVRVHPKFLHSNATSHKWALGAIAELLDNAIDEVSNGATYVSVDKATNPSDGSPALLVQDDGGGMDPDNMRHCMSLGYSRKASTTTIGQYGNGFKTSTMRLGADVIVFSRSMKNRCPTQSIGMLSYTFLRATGHEDIVVPMVDFDLSQGKANPKMLVRSTKEDWLNNLSTIVQWSPYNSETELLKQFENIGEHGTKIIVYNLWMNDDGELELDFDIDKKDIQVRGASKSAEKFDTLQKQLTNQHIVNRLRYSLRAYSSILYLRMPSNFKVILRGAVVEHLSIADDLKFSERILYKPQMGNSRESSSREVSVITTIGFAKEAPMVSVHGFNVYHKNRLIMPFWKVFQENSSRGRGVVGVLEANFIEPAHDKQDFERTPILQRLETRLKQMTIEYWNLHCELIGYQPPKSVNKSRPSQTVDISVKSWEATNGLNSPLEGRPGETSAPSTPPQTGSDSDSNQDKMDQKPDVSKMCSKAEGTSVALGSALGKSSLSNLPPSESILGKRMADLDLAVTSKRQVPSSAVDTVHNKEAIVAIVDGTVSVPTMSPEEVLEELEQLRAKCAEYQQREEDLKSKVRGLETELLEYKCKYNALVGKPAQLKKPKEEC